MSSPKNAGEDNLQLTGAGACIAEIDGNLTVSNDDMTVVHWQAKLRGTGLRTYQFPAEIGDARTPENSKGTVVSDNR